MNIILSTGIIIFSAFILGELAELAKLPKISGYILAGIFLNPDLFNIVTENFLKTTDPLLTISLSLITFSIGGALTKDKIKKTGKSMLSLMAFESLSAFIFVFIFTFLSFWLFLDVLQSINMILMVSLVLASLAAPTDPSATLAVIHEYNAKGKVSSSMLEIAAFDDIAGIIIFTLVTAFAGLLIGQSEAEAGHAFLDLGRDISGAIILGVIIGFLFNYMIKLFKKESEGSLIVLTFGLVLLGYGIAEYFDFEALLSTMTLGIMVTNFNPHSDKIFKLIERYTDELIFVIFFSLSGLHLQLSSITGSAVIIAVFVVARIIGKYSGVYSGSILLNTDKKVKKYAAGGLIPQGGIVIGMALLLTKDPAFNKVSSLIMGVVIGAALIHEIIGPITSRYSLKKAGEINTQT